MGVFVNGDTTIHNVPYSKHFKYDSIKTIRPSAEGDNHHDSHKNHAKQREGDSAAYDLYLTHDVLFQLSHIIKTMQEKGLKTVDYQRFLISNSKLADSSGYGATAGVCAAIPNESIEDREIKGVNRVPYPKSLKTSYSLSNNSKNETEKRKTQIRKNVLNNWLKNYYAMKMQAKAVHTKNHGGNTKTKAEKAAEWLAYFHERLQGLPEMERNIIKKKYLEIEKNGQCPTDEVVISELFIGQRQYYYRKKEALYLLGLALGDSWNI